MQIIAHKILHYSLIFPCIASMLLGMFTAGSFMYEAQVKQEQAQLVSHITDLSLKQLSQIEI